MSVFPSDRSLLAIGGLTLVAPSLKIMYTPTPKVACSTIKLMLATAEQSHRTDLIDQITNPSVSRPQTIHDPVINGLPRLVNLPKKEIQQRINEAQADQKWEGYAVSKAEFITILQSICQ